jgi:hypothetical protein
MKGRPRDKDKKGLAVESESIKNVSWAPGWSQHDKIVLKNALMKFGIGRWKVLEA